MFPDTLGTAAAMSADEWFSGANEKVLVRILAQQSFMLGKSKVDVPFHRKHSRAYPLALLLCMYQEVPCISLTVVSFYLIVCQTSPVL